MEGRLSSVGSSVSLVYQAQKSRAILAPGFQNIFEPRLLLSTSANNTN